jgi:hypothetical protein
LSVSRKTKTVLKLGCAILHYTLNMLLTRLTHLRITTSAAFPYRNRLII